MCIVRDKDWITWPAMMKTAVHISWSMLPTMSVLRGWPKAVGEEPRRRPRRMSRLAFFAFQEVPSATMERHGFPSLA